jgi:hypothetical protein
MALLKWAISASLLLGKHLSAQELRKKFSQKPPILPPKILV